MVDLSPASRLTRKRNMLLQKQLGVQLQILADEYRMTKKDLEKNSRDLGVFLMCLRDKAPGLSAYGQPDTRAMNAKNILHDKQTSASKKKDPEDVVSLVSKKTTKESKSPSSSDSHGGDDRNDNDPSKSPATRNTKNEFFNRRIVLDSRRRSFLQHSLNKDGGKPPDPRRLGGAATHVGFLSNRDTPGEMTSKPPRPQTAAPLSQRSKTPRYGSDAYSEREESIRQEVLGRFHVIFDPQNVKRTGTIKRSTPSATPLYIPVGTSIPEHDVSPGPTEKAPPGPPHMPTSGYVLNRRVAWSAPPKRREAPVNAGGRDGHADAGPAAGNRQNMSVTPRSGTAGMKDAYRRSSSACIVRSTASVADGRDKGRSQPVSHSQSQNPPPGPKDPHSHRPKTAPPVYQLMQKSVAAPRQQVAGILAEIQSRRADTRAILLKSRQLKKMVKALAPEEKDEDSFSD